MNENLQKQMPKKRYQSQNTVFKSDIRKPTTSSVSKWPAYDAPINVQKRTIQRFPISNRENVHN